MQDVNEILDAYSDMQEDLRQRGKSRLEAHAEVLHRKAARALKWSRRFGRIADWFIARSDSQVDRARYLRDEADDALEASWSI